MTDTPPAGVTLLSFEVSVSGATLNPGGVDLLGGKGQIQIEVKQLETESAFLSTATVTPGTFTSLTLTFGEFADRHPGGRQPRHNSRRYSGRGF